MANTRGGTSSQNCRKSFANAATTVSACWCISAISASGRKYTLEGVPGKLPGGGAAGDGAAAGTLAEGSAAGVAGMVSAVVAHAASPAAPGASVSLTTEGYDHKRAVRTSFDQPPAAPGALVCVSVYCENVRDLQPLGSDQIPCQTGGLGVARGRSRRRLECLRVRRAGRCTTSQCGPARGRSTMAGMAAAASKNRHFRLLWPSRVFCNARSRAAGAPLASRLPVVAARRRPAARAYLLAFVEHCLASCSP